MSRHGYTRVFRDPEVKAEMLSLRLQGYSFVELARKYDCDHTSVIHQCQLEGIALKKDTREALFALKDQGFTPEQIAVQLKLSGTVVEFYCYRYGIRGNQIYGRTYLHLEPVAPRPPKIHVPVAPQPKAILVRMDDRGVEWRDDGHGGWICSGMSEKQYKQDLVEKKKRDLEKRRLEMLTY